MENFTAFNPTKLIFGKGVTQSIPEHLKGFGKKVLLVYGKGSIKNNGIYKEIIKLLKESGKTIIEFEGIKPNPIVTDVEKAIALGRKNKVDFVMAAGGGSIIDSAKIIALCIPEGKDPWLVMKYKEKATKSLPIVTILTLAATGTEMNQFAVLQNEKTKEKIGFGSPLIYPALSYCDPTYTKSVSKEYTAYGIADIIAHSLEAYFGDDDATLSDRFVVSIIHEMANAGPKLLNDLKNYDLRARVMWASTCALNGMTFYGRKSGDWGVHDLGHILSLLYDMPHGASLSIAYPAWLKYHSKTQAERILWIGKEAFGTNTVKQSITAFEKLFIKLQCPIRLQQLRIDPSKKKEIISLMLQNKVSGMVIKLNEKAVKDMVDLMFEG